MKMRGLVAFGTAILLIISGCSSDGDENLLPDNQASEVSESSVDSPVVSTCDTSVANGVSELMRVASSSSESEPAPFQVSALLQEFDGLTVGCLDVLPQPVGADDTPVSILNRLYGAG